MDHFYQRIFFSTLAKNKFSDMDKAIILARCSTNEKRQDVNRQVQDLTTKYSNQFGLIDTISHYKNDICYIGKEILLN